MAEDFAVRVAGDRKVALEFDHEIEATVHDRLVGAVTEITERLYAAVEGDVPRRTGKLASEIGSSVEVQPDRIRGRVMVEAEFAKAGAEEYGAHRPAKVKSHHMRLDHVFTHRLNAPLDVIVSAYERPTNITARRFERGPLQTMTPEIEDKLQEAVQQAVAQVNT